LHNENIPPPFLLIDIIAIKKLITNCY